MTKHSYGEVVTKYISHGPFKVKVVVCQANFLHLNPLTVMWCLLQVAMIFIPMVCSKNDLYIHVLN